MIKLHVAVTFEDGGNVTLLDDAVLNISGDPKDVRTIQTLLNWERKMLDKVKFTYEEIE
jgi:hypothetical protein